ncbi:MAG: MFS transporter, partial [Acidobacteriota bacterium]
MREAVAAEPAVGDRARRPLAGLLFAQFFGAFNDNAWKLFVALLGMRALALQMGAGSAEFEAASQTRTTQAFVIFTLPLLLASLPAGALADRVSKRSIIVVLKAVEILLMAAGTLTLVVQPAGGALLLVILALMGTQSALFSPAKYGILPEILPHEKLSSGNGLLEMTTFLAIIVGTGCGAALLDVTGDRPWLAGALLTVLAVAGFVASRRVPRVAPSRGDASMTETIRGAWSVMRSERILGMTVLGLTFFWGIASLLGQDILVYGKAYLRLGDTQAGALLVVFGLGVGCGTVLAGRWSGSKVEYGLIPLGALGFGVLSLLLGALAPGFGGTLVLLALLGLASGLLVVPMDALLQWRSPARRRGGVIALANVFIFTGVLAGSLGVQALAWMGLSAPQILLAAAVMTIAGTVWSLWLLPDALLRLVLILLTHTFYRLEVIGREHVPRRGGALLVPNHVSFADGLFLLASLDRRVRFIVDQEYFNHPLLKPCMKALGAIPISPSGGPRVILRAFREAGRYLDEGQLVCIFAEGQITRTGMLLSFRRGFERILKNRPVSIIPVSLDRVWGSIFSRAGGRFITKLPRRVPYPVTVSFGAALPPQTPLEVVRRSVHELGEAAWMHRKADMRTLHADFIRVCRRHPFSFVMADPARPRLSRLQALAGAVALARRLRGRWGRRGNAGILLPPGVPGGLVNLAAALSGRVSVNLNFTTGRAGMASAARQADLTRVVTSRVFLQKAKLEWPADLEPIWIEEIAGGIGVRERAWAWVLALLAPARWLERACGAGRRIGVDDTATIIFSSGSTGDPKGVELSHFNIASNVEALAQVFRVEPSDSVLGVLPLFHSFGYLTLWFALTKRMAVVFYPNPTDAAAVGELVQRYRVSFLLATPTFLQLYMRRCTPAQFGSLRVVLTGAEKLPESVSRSFEDHFGIRPLEGYGATECSPAIAVSVPDYRAAGFYQPGSHRGFVGQPLPGVAVRIVDPDTFE